MENQQDPSKIIKEKEELIPEEPMSEPTEESMPEPTEEPMSESTEEPMSESEDSISPVAMVESNESPMESKLKELEDRLNLLENKVDSASMSVKATRSNKCPKGCIRKTRCKGKIKGGKTASKKGTSRRSRKSKK
jgi:hypothetical protein